MSWETFLSILSFLCGVFFIALAVLGFLIVVAAILIGAYRGFQDPRLLGKRKPPVDRDPMI